MELILVDSSVWIDLLADRRTVQTKLLRDFLDNKQAIGIGDLVATEVLQGARSENQFEKARYFLDAFVPVRLGGSQVAVQAARNYRVLRTKGITIRKTIDTLIATRCILDGLALLYADRDFDPFVQHLGLRSAMDLATGTN